MDAWQIQDKPDVLQDLLISLGIYQTPAIFGLSPVVSPVSIVDSRIAIAAVVTAPVWDFRVTAGELNNPAANTRLADTGQLAAGTYEMLVQFTILGGLFIRLKQRNATDTADISSEATWNAGYYTYTITRIHKIAASERVVVENSLAPGAGNILQAIIWGRKL